MPFFLTLLIFIASWSRVALGGHEDVRPAQGSHGARGRRHRPERADARRIPAWRFTT